MGAAVDFDARTRVVSGAMCRLAVICLLAAYGTLGCRRPSGEQGNASAPGSSVARMATAPSAAPSPAASTPKRSLLGARTRAVVAGVLSWKDAQLSPFSPEKRKDRELAEALVQRARVPRSEVTTLLDRAATRAAILSAVETAAGRTRPGDTLVFYYAGHGVLGDDGLASLAPVDMVVAEAATTGIGMRALDAALAKVPAGSSALLMGDHCYSGALREVAELLSKRGVEAAALTSAEASNTSTSNWTFTQTVIDALGGDPLADRDGDRTITLEEVALESRDAMKFREAQRSGFWARTLSRAAFASASAAPARRTGAPQLGDYVKLTGQPRVVGRVVGAGKGSNEVVIRTLDYATVGERTAPAKDLEPLRYRSYPVGNTLVVERDGAPYDAKVTAVDGDFMRVTYPGAGPALDEWILDNRVLAEQAPDASAAVMRKVGAKVEVEWNQDFYPATIVKTSDKLWLVHYDGYAASWDEWVGPSRTRDRRVGIRAR